MYKVELFYQFWNTTANAEKQLLQWLGEVGGLEDNKPGYATEVLNTVSNIFIYVSLQSEIPIKVCVNEMSQWLVFIEALEREMNVA